MNKKRGYFSVLAGLLLLAGVVEAQDYPVLPMPTPLAGGEPTAPVVAPTPLLPGPGHGNLVPSDWILYRRPESCCGPMNGDGPLKTEFFLRAGWSFPFGSGVYGETLTTGWSIQGGARLMLFDPVRTAAWSLELSGSNTWNQGKATDIRVPLSILVPNPQGVVERVELGQGNLPGVTPRDLNRTFVNLAIGRWWWLAGPANGCAWNWRVGIDGGGGYGTGSAQFFEIRGRSDVMGRAFVGAQTDMEIPCGCCVFHGGLRGEYSYTWSDILQRPSDVQEILLLFNIGVRY